MFGRRSRAPPLYLRLDGRLLGPQLIALKNKLCEHEQRQAQSIESRRCASGAIINTDRIIVPVPPRDIKREVLAAFASLRLDEEFRAFVEPFLDRRRRLWCVGAQFICAMQGAALVFLDMCVLML